MNIDKRALKGVVDEIEASRARQKAETEFQREALKRAVKNHQLDAKAIRIVLQRRAMGQTKRDEQDYYVHAYELALGAKKDAIEALERNEGVRATAKATGLSTGAVSALKKGVQKSSFVNTPHDPDTGEISSAAPHGREDDASATPPADSVVPPTANPQMESVGPPSVAPAPSVGIEAGGHSEDDPGEEPAEWHRADVYQVDDGCGPDATPTEVPNSPPQPDAYSTVDSWAEADAARARVEALKARRQKATA